MSGSGSGLAWRIARSTPTQRPNAPALTAILREMSNSATPFRIVASKRSAANASIATPPANRARAVLTQAKKVRSFARVNLGSGSRPSGSNRRASQLR